MSKISVIWPGHWYVALFFICFSPVYTISMCNYEMKNRVIIVAMLNLHDETSNCTKVSLRGLQQQAIAEKTAADINSNVLLSEGMNVAVNVVDVCSAEDKGVSAAMKSLVSVNQTCMNPPLLIGFIGPENINQLYAVQHVTSSIRKFHILPFIPDSKNNISDSSLLYVGNSRTTIRSKIILAVLNQVKWKSLYAVVEESDATAGTLEYLLREINRLCITGMTKIPRYLPKVNTFYPNLIREYQNTGADGLLILADDPGNVRPLLDIMRDYSQPGDIPNPPTIMYVNRIGLKSWELPRNFSILMLQETSEIFATNSVDLLKSNPLTNTYYEQNEVDFKHDAFADNLDPTVTALEYSLKLYWNAAIYAKNIKCKLGLLTANTDGICSEMYGISPNDWKAFLYKASFHDVLMMKKVSLQMNLPVTVKIYLTDAIVNTPQLIGRITDIGITELHVNLAETFPRSKFGNPKRCLSPLGFPVRTTISEIPMIIDNDASWFATLMAYGQGLFNIDEKVIRKTNLLNTIILCSIAIVVFLGCIIIVSKCVYRTFRVQSPEEREEKLRRKQGRNLRIFST